MTFSSLSCPEFRSDHFWRFLNSVKRVGDHNADDVYYAYIDWGFSGGPLPETAEEAYEMGLLIIEATSPGIYYLRIENDEYESQSVFYLEQILLKWAIGEGYRW